MTQLDIAFPYVNDNGCAHISVYQLEDSSASKPGEHIACVSNEKFLLLSRSEWMQFFSHSAIIGDTCKRVAENTDREMVPYYVSTDNFVDRKKVLGLTAGSSGIASFLQSHALLQPRESDQASRPLLLVSGGYDTKKQCFVSLCRTGGSKEVEKALLKKIKYAIDEALPLLLTYGDVDYLSDHPDLEKAIADAIFSNNDSPFGSLRVRSLETAMCEQIAVNRRPFRIEDVNTSKGQFSLYYLPKEFESDSYFSDQENISRFLKLFSLSHLSERKPVLSFHDLYVNAIPEEREKGFEDSEWQTFRKTLLAKPPVTRKRYAGSDLVDQAIEKAEELFSAEASRNIIISGPTGTGKTSLANALILNGVTKCWEGSALYLGPTKAIVDQIHRDWAAHYEETLNEMYSQVGNNFSSVVKSTGDHSEDDWRLQGTKLFKAAFIVNEKANLFINADLPLWRDLRVVVIDELHMLEDSARGRVVDLFLAKLKLEQQRRIHDDAPFPLQIIVITTERLGSYVSSLNTPDPQSLFDLAPIEIFIEKRPVKLCTSLSFYGPTCCKPDEDKQELIPLVDFLSNRDRYQENTDFLKPFDEKYRQVRNDLVKTRPKDRNDKAGYRDSQLSTKRNKELEIAEAVLKISQQKSARSILVIVEKVQLGLGVCRMLSALRKPYMSTSKEKMREQIVKACARGIGFTANTIAELGDLAANGVFFHASDFDKFVRGEVENIFTSQQDFDSPKFCVATETLSFGVNLDADTIVLTSHIFPRQNLNSHGVTHKPLSANEFHNIIGRAGRLGVMGSEQAHSNAILLFDEDKLLNRGSDGTATLRNWLVKMYSPSAKSTTDDVELTSSLFTNLKKFGRGYLTGRESDAVSIISDHDIHTFLDLLSYCCVSGAEEGTPGVTTIERMTEVLAQTFFFNYYGRGMNSLKLPVSAQEKRQLTKAYLRHYADFLIHNKLDVITDNGGELAITPKGHSLIATGTSYQAADEMANGLQLLKAFASENRDAFGVLPLECFLPVIMLPNEACSKWIKMTAEDRFSYSLHKQDRAKKAQSKVDEQAKNINLRIAEYDFLKACDFFTPNESVKRNYCRLVQACLFGLDENTMRTAEDLISVQDSRFNASAIVKSHFKCRKLSLATFYKILTSLIYWLNEQSVEQIHGIFSKNRKTLPKELLEEFKNTYHDSALRLSMDQFSLRKDFRWSPSNLYLVVYKARNFFNFYFEGETRKLVVDTKMSSQFEKRIRFGCRKDTLPFTHIVEKGNMDIDLRYLRERFIASGYKPNGLALLAQLDEKNAFLRSSMGYIESLSQVRVEEENLISRPNLTASCDQLWRSFVNLFKNEFQLHLKYPLLKGGASDAYLALIKLVEKQVTSASVYENGIQYDWLAFNNKVHQVLMAKYGGQVEVFEHEVKMRTDEGRFIIFSPYAANPAENEQRIHYGFHGLAPSTSRVNNLSVYGMLVLLLLLDRDFLIHSTLDDLWLWFETKSKENGMIRLYEIIASDYFRLNEAKDQIMMEVALFPEPVF